MLNIALLGPLRVSDSCGRVSLGPQLRVLMLALLSEPDRVVSGNRLAQLLWGAPTSDCRVATLRSHVSHLRQLLRASAPGLIRTHPGGYALELGAVQLDSVEFRMGVLVAQHTLAGGKPETAAELAETALALWRGPAFADAADRPFAQPEIARLNGLRRAAIRCRANALLNLGRVSEIAGELEGQLASDPDDEQLRQLLAVALHRARHLAAAAAVCREGIERLHSLGIVPDRLQQLQRAILRDDPTFPSADHAQLLP